MKKQYIEPEFEALRFTFSSLMDDLAQHSAQETGGTGGHSDDGGEGGDDINL